jgi:hypothetical protein
MSIPVIRSNLIATSDVNNPPKLNDRYALLSTKDGKTILVQLTCNGKKENSQETISIRMSSYHSSCQI